MRRNFFRRIGCLLGLVVVLLFAAGGLTGWLLPGHHFGRSPGGPGPSIGFFVLLLVVIAIVVGRAIRRTAAPIADVMEAADRVASGDYAVRVNARGSGEVSRLVDSFNAMTTRLQTNEAQRRHLLADVTHELRTPLAVIRGNVEGMLDGVYPRDDERLNVILEEAAVMDRLLDDLRTLSLAEAGVLRLYREAVDVRALVEEVVAAYGPRAAEAGIDLAATVAPLPELEVDPVRLRQVLENLIGNALRYTPRGGSVRVGTEQAGESAGFSVADTGPGIGADELPHIFDRFWKSADSGGSGLGLAIAKSLVEAHGGAIRAESQPGLGTTIRFTLPFG